MGSSAARAKPPVVLEQPRPQEEALCGIPMEVGIPRTPPRCKRPNLQTVGSEAAHLESVRLERLAARAHKLHPTVAYYPEVTLIIFGPLPKVRSFLWDTGGTEESLISRLFIQSWACSFAIERVVWTDLLRLEDALFDEFDAAMRGCSGKASTFG